MTAVGVTLASLVAPDPGRESAEPLVAAVSVVACAALAWTLVPIAIGVVTRFVRRGATRHTAWVVALAALPVVIALVFASPSWLAPFRSASPLAPVASEPSSPASRVEGAAVRVDARSTDALPRASGAGAPDRRVGSVDVASPPLSARTVFERARSGWVRFAPWIVAVWWVGAVALVSRSVVGHRAARRWRRGAEEPIPSDVLEEFEDVAAAAGVVSVRLTLRRDLPVPATIGVRAPVVLLPVRASSWPAAIRRAVLAHELAHVARRDNAVRTAARAIRALFWWHPAVWLVTGAIDRAAEYACDEAAVRAGATPVDYATALVRVAAELRGETAPAFGAALLSAGGLRGRVRRVLDGRSYGPSRVGQIAVVAFGGAATLAVAGLAIGASPPDDAEPWWHAAGTTEAPAWSLDCPDGDPLCDAGNSKALDLLERAGGTGTVVVQSVPTGRLVTFASAGDPAGPLASLSAPPASVAKLALAAAWWEAGLPDVDVTCDPSVTIAGRTVRSAFRETTAQRGPHDFVVTSCNTSAARVADRFLEARGGDALRDAYARFGFASGESDAGFWSTDGWIEPPAPSDRIDDVANWIPAAVGAEGLTTTPLHVSRFLQAIGNGGVALAPDPDSVEEEAAATRMVGAETSRRLRRAMREAVERGTAKRVVPQLEWSDWKLAGKTGTSKDGERLDGWFAGLVFDARGNAAYTVVVWLRDGGYGGGRPAGIAAEMTRFFAREAGGEL